MAQPSRRDRAIDVHTHAMPMPLLGWLAELGLADLSGAAEETIRLDSRVSGVGDRVPLPLARSQHDVDTRLSEMDDMGISHHAVSMPPFLFCSTADDGELVKEVVARGNDELATYAAGGHGRLIPLGSVPMGWPGTAAEAKRCLDDLQMGGIAIGSRGAGSDLDDPVNEELWQLLAERRTFVFLHPSGVPDAHRQRDFYLAQLAGYPMETALAVARLAFGRVLERFELTLCLAHGGGCLPAIRGRLDMGWRNKKIARTTAEPPSVYASRLYYDTAVFSPVLLRRLAEDYGASHVLLGTDHPFELRDADPLSSVAAAELTPAEARAILWGNAAALLGLA